MSSINSNNCINSEAQNLVSRFLSVVEGKPQFPRHEFFAELRQDLPNFRSDRLDAWAVSRYDDVKNVLFSNSQFQPPQGGAGASAYGRSFMQMSPIPREEIASNIIFLLVAGVETTARVLTNVLRHVALDPAEGDWLKANYTDPESLSAFCAEALRFYPLVNANIRTVSEEGEIVGVKVRPGEKICALSVSASATPAVFPMPPASITSASWRQRPPVHGWGRHTDLQRRHPPLRGCTAG